MRMMLVLAMIGALGHAAPAAEPALDMKQRAAELQKLHWGMFICWSFSTFSGKEWTPGVKDVAFFRATQCDTDQWAKTAKEAEMGYILFLAKHHDGFCLWDTATTDRKVTRAPLGRDVLAELRKSCDAHGVKLALYFSEGDWTFPGAVDGKGGKGGGTNPEMKKAQLRELLTKYGPIEFIWFDHAAGDGGLDHKSTVEWVHQFQPGCLVGFNHGAPAGELRLGEMGRPTPLADPSGAGYGASAAKGYAGYLLAEFTYPILPPHEGGAMWFYSLPKHDGLCLPPAKIYRDWAGAVKHGNIFSLDAGPNYEGRLREIDVKTLQTVGKMIRGEIPPPAIPLSQGQAASASETWSPEYSAARAFDGDPSSRWGGGQGKKSGWVEVRLDKPASVGQLVVLEFGNRTRRFELQYRDGEAWKTALTGTTLGDRYEKSLTPVTAQVFRLNIIESTDTPSIYEIELHPPK